MQDNNTERRIGWLDSAGMPSRVHKTADGGKTTVCGHNLTSKQNCRWVVQSEVPRKNHGTSRYCRICFKNGGKTLPWFIP